MKKKVIIPILVATIAIVLTGCGKGKIEESKVEKDDNREVESNIEDSNTEDKNHIDSSEKDDKEKQDNSTGNNKNDVNDSVESNNNSSSNNVNTKPSDESNNINIKPESNEGTVSEESNTVTKSLRIYYYDAVNDKIVYTSREVAVVDKAITKALVEELKKSVSSTIASSINPESNVRVASINQDTKTLTVDFTGNLLSSNLGSGVESSSLQAIANTFGYNLGVNNVIIKVNGKPYQSGHIDMKEGESFKVNYDITSPM